MPQEETETTSLPGSFVVVSQGRSALVCSLTKEEVKRECQYKATLLRLKNALKHVKPNACLVTKRERYVHVLYLIFKEPSAVGVIVTILDVYGLGRARY